MNGRLMWCDFGANLVQHFIGRYSRYSRYQTALSKLQEIITALRRLFRYTKSSASAELFCFVSVIAIPKSPLISTFTSSKNTKPRWLNLLSTICFNQKGRFDYMLSRLFWCKFGTTLHMIKRYLQTAPFVI